MGRYRAENKREMGSSGMMLMLGHHCISLVLWPYCLLTHKVARGEHTLRASAHRRTRTPARPSTHLPSYPHRCGFPALWQSAFFVAFYLFTELTNVGQNIFHFCNKSGVNTKART